MNVSKAELKKIKAQNSKKGRREQKRFTVGGVRLLEESARSNFLPIRVFHSKKIDSERCKKLVDCFRKAGVETTELSNKELDSISDTVTPQEILATFEIPASSLSKLYKPSFRRVLLCDKISDPGNLGTLARSALAFGFNMMLVTDMSAEIFNPKVIRSSAGALFHLPALQVSVSEIIELKNTHKVQIMSSTTKSDKKDMPDTEKPIVLVIGSEADGISDEILDISDFNISIPHRSVVESLNAAVAGSILMNKLYQRE